jgi:hypothetical protein
MRKRQIKKIINSYYWDTDEDILLPPSVMKEQFRAEEVYFSKAFMISYPEQAEEMQKKLAERIEEESKKAQELTTEAGNV